MIFGRTAERFITTLHPVIANDVRAYERLPKIQTWYFKRDKIHGVRAEPLQATSLTAVGILRSLRAGERTVRNLVER